MKEFFIRSDAYTSQIRDFIECAKSDDFIEQFSCSVDISYSATSAFQKGTRHSKTPAQEVFLLAVRWNGRFADGKSFLVHFTGTSFPDFVSCYQNAKTLAVAVKHLPHMAKHDSYPTVELASADFLAILEDPKGMSRVDEIAIFLDELAGRVQHPRLLSRETQVVLGCNKRIYFDSVENFAQEFSTVCDLSVSFSLSDSIESYSDSFGGIPEPSEIERVVAEAARNLTLHDVREFEDSKDAVVTLTPKAVVTLFEELVLSNLSMRAILDGTCAWSVDNLNEVVLPGVTLYDNPLKPYSPFSKIFDIEGTPASDVVIVKDGRLLHPLFTAALLAEFQNKNSYHLTGHAIGAMETSFTNLAIDISARSTETFAEMIDGVPVCVVVSNLTGMSVDPLTGQFALDAEGARVYKDGKLAYSTSITLRGNFFEALADPASFVGPVERISNVYAPSFRTRKLFCVSRKLVQEE